MNKRAIKRIANEVIADIIDQRVTVPASCSETIADRKRFIAAVDEIICYHRRNARTIEPPNPDQLSLMDVW